MTLTLYNTLTRKKETLEPVVPGRVGMYVCGPTVYDYAHIGNARPVVVFDVLYRLLKRLFPKVTYVRNITDVDDDMLAAARRRGVHHLDLAFGVTRRFDEDMAALGNIAPWAEPRAS
ncbi:MAG: cysteine--tRNA ligase, partial [Rhodospirillales bacterium]|nr:cysteine--tRNA ligase [Rhodospirillales bacterium]